MNPKDDIYIGKKSRAKRCPVCMRTKEDAIAEQLQTGKPCDHVHCEFNPEIELIFNILKAPDIEGLKTQTTEQIQSELKMNGLLISIRDHVRDMKDSLISTISRTKETSCSAEEHSCQQEGIQKEVFGGGQVQFILDRIGKATTTLSKLLENKRCTLSQSTFKQHVTKTNRIITPMATNAASVPMHEPLVGGNDHINTKESIQQKYAEAWARVDKALKGMREEVKNMKAAETEQNARPSDSSS